MRYLRCLLLAVLALLASAADVRDYKTPDRGWREAITAAAAANPGGVIDFPVTPGHYLIDNQDGPLVLTAFSGTLRFAPGSKLICSSPARGCFTLSGGSFARLENIRIVYQPAPVERIFEPALQATATHDLRISGAVIENSPGAGILIGASYRPVVTNSSVLSSLADGISFENTEDGTVTDSTTNDTGDDGISFINYDRSNQIDFPDLRGGRAHNVRVRNSRSRGIAVPGQSNVLVTNFVIENTSASGILVLNDTSFRTRRPSNVIFRNGFISRAGRLEPSQETPYAINYSGTEGTVEFTDITVVDPLDRGLSGTAPNGRIRARNIRVTGGVDAVNIGRTRSVELSGITSEDAGGYGVFVNTGGNWAVVQDLVIVNASRSSSLRRAVWFENNGDVQGRNITVVDEQNTPTGYIVGGFQNGRLVVTGIRGITRGGGLNSFVCPESTAGSRYVCEPASY